MTLTVTRLPVLPKPPSSEEISPEETPPTATAGRSTSPSRAVLLLGEDSKDNDRNKVIDDYMQCTEGPDVDDEFGIETTDEEGIKATCVPASGDVVDTDDTTESRSKLLVTGGESNDPTVSALIDGSTITHNMGEAAGATIHAVLEDAKGNRLEDVEVTFTATTNPSGIIPERDERDEVDTKLYTSATLVEGIDNTPAASGDIITPMATAVGCVLHSTSLPDD